MTSQPPDRRRPLRPQDMRSAMRRLLWAIAGATTFTVLMLYFELLGTSENSSSTVSTRPGTSPRSPR